jgi:amino acid transporter
VFGRVHPRWKTPHVAFYAQAVIASVLLLASLWGVNIYQAYVTLLRLTAIVNLIPFLYLFAGLLRLARSADVEANRRTWLFVNGAAGCVATAVALVASFIPDAVIESVLIFEVKLIAGVALFLGTAMVLFYWREGLKRRERAMEAAK